MNSFEWVFPRISCIWIKLTSAKILLGPSPRPSLPKQDLIVSQLLKHQIRMTSRIHDESDVDVIGDDPLGDLTGKVVDQLDLDPGRLLVNII